MKLRSLFFWFWVFLCSDRSVMSEALGTFFLFKYRQIWFGIITVFHRSFAFLCFANCNFSMKSPVSSLWPLLLLSLNEQFSSKNRLKLRNHIHCSFMWSTLWNVIVGEVKNKYIDLKNNKRKSSSYSFKLWGESMVTLGHWYVQNFRIWAYL